MKGVIHIYGEELLDDLVPSAFALLIGRDLVVLLD